MPEYVQVDAGYPARAVYTVIVKTQCDLFELSWNRCIYVINEVGLRMMIIGMGNPQLLRRRSN